MLNVKSVAECIHEDLRIITGEVLEPSDVTLRDVMRTLACNLEVWGRRLNAGDFTGVDICHALMDEFRGKPSILELLPSCTQETLDQVKSGDVDKIRKQMEDADFPPGLSDNQVLVADYLAREYAAKQAREVPNPWNLKNGFEPPKGVIDGD